MGALEAAAGREGPWRRDRPDLAGGLVCLPARGRLWLKPIQEEHAGPGSLAAASCESTASVAPGASRVFARSSSMILVIAYEHHCRTTSSEQRKRSSSPSTIPDPLSPIPFNKTKMLTLPSSCFCWGVRCNAIINDVHVRCKHSNPFLIRTRLSLILPSSIRVPQH